MTTAPIHPDTSKTSHYPRASGPDADAREQFLHPLVAAAFREFQQANLRWCLLRQPTKPEAPLGDVDLLIDREDRAAAFQILGRLGYSRLPAWGYGSASFFLGYHPGTDHWIWLHLVSELAFGPYYLLQSGAESGCLTRREQHGTIVELASDDAFWVLLLHRLLDKERIPSRHRPRLRELVTLARPDSSLALYTAGICPPGWNPEYLITAIEREEWGRLTHLPPRLVSTAMRATPCTIHRQMTLAGLRLASQASNLLQPILWRRYIGQQRRRLRSRYQPRS